MNLELLKEELSKPEYEGLSVGEVVEALNGLTETTIRPRFVTARTLLAELPNGAELLDKLTLIATQVSAVKWAMKFLESEGGIDIGHPSTQAQIDALVAGNALTTQEGNALKGLALSPCSRADLLFGATIYGCTIESILQEVQNAV